MDGKPMMRKAWMKTGYSWFVEEDDPAVDLAHDEEVNAIDHYDDYDYEEEELNIMMEEEGMADDVRAMTMEDMKRCGIAIDNDNGEEEEDHEMWTMNVYN
jgi:hypothetical protein